jgi:hypothetical protein
MLCTGRLQSGRVWWGTCVDLAVITAVVLDAPQGLAAVRAGWDQP